MVDENTNPDGKEIEDGETEEQENELGEEDEQKPAHVIAYKNQTLKLEKAVAQSAVTWARLHGLTKAAKKRFEQTTEILSDHLNSEAEPSLFDEQEDDK